MYFLLLISYFGCDGTTHIADVEKRFSTKESCLIARENILNNQVTSTEAVCEVRYERN